MENKKKIICALIIGRKGSIGFPKKNLYPLLGRPMVMYPILAAKKSKMVEKIYVSTDDPKIKKIANKENIKIIDRPKKLASKKALGTDVFEHGYYFIKKDIEKQNLKIDLIVLLHANSPTLTTKLIDNGIKILKKNKKFDSAVTTSVYNMWSPIRARKLNKKGQLRPMVPFKNFINPNKLSSDRDAQGNVYYADMSISVVRPFCLENIKDGLLPQKWMGNKIAPIFSEGGCDVDFEWQIPMVEFWLKKNGYKNAKKKTY
tara:strand:+ start:224 stop:1000 length:777 start_codon:yes stop_codon:yes gene_type:complete